jgi:hypothetical protein
MAIASRYGIVGTMALAVLSAYAGFLAEYAMASLNTP